MAYRKKPAANPSDVSVASSNDPTITKGAHQRPSTSLRWPLIAMPSKYPRPCKLSLERQKGAGNLGWGNKRGRGSFRLSGTTVETKGDGGINCTYRMSPLSPFHAFISPICYVAYHASTMFLGHLHRPRSRSRHEYFVGKDSDIVIRVEIEAIRTNNPDAPIFVFIMK